MAENDDTDRTNETLMRPVHTNMNTIADQKPNEMHTEENISERSRRLTQNGTTKKDEQEA